MSTEALFAAGYSVFLVLAALGLDRLARHSHARSGRYRTAGFTFREDLDAWECPEGEYLRRIHLDESRRLVRYRARAAVCNACPAKSRCTESDEGREIVRALDPWPHSEAGRFHRGICVVLSGLGALIALIALARADTAAEVLMLAVGLGLAAAVTGRLLEAFRRTPSGFPVVASAGKLGPESHSSQGAPGPAAAPRR